MTAAVILAQLVFNILHSAFVVDGVGPHLAAGSQLYTSLACLGHTWLDGHLFGWLVGWLLNVLFSF